MRNRRLVPAGRICLSLMVVLSLTTPAFAQLTGQGTRKHVRPEKPEPGSQTPPGEPRAKKPLTTEQQGNAAHSKAAAVAKFRQKYGAETRVTWSPKTGLPTLVYNFSAAKAVEDDSEAARQFISDSRDLLLKGEDISNLHLLARRESEGAVHIDFRQFYRDVPVWHASLSVHLIGGRITMVNGTYVPDIQLDTIPALSADEAVEAAKRDLGGESYGSSDKYPPELVISMGSGKSVLCWHVSILSSVSLSDWEYLIDATSGAVVEKIDAVQRATGSGVVYAENPEATPFPVSLPFENLDNSGTLHGSFVDVRSFKTIDLAFNLLGTYDSVSPSLAFNFTPPSPPFSEQMVYYHANRTHSFFKLLGFDQLDAPLTTFVHYVEREKPDRPYENAAFLYLRDDLVFGDGSGLPGGVNNPSYDGEIIAHEYTHALLFKLRDSLLRGKADSYGAAMNEGYADYVAGTLFNTPIIGQWMFKPTPQKLRRLDNLNHSPEDEKDQSGKLEAYHTSLIWSGSLWDVRASLGPAVADKLILNSATFLPREPEDLNFQAGLIALIMADRAVRFGADVPTIQSRLNARGIFEPGATQFTPLTSGTAQSGTIPAAALGSCLLPAQQFTINVPPGTSSLSLDASGNGPINLYARLGSPVTVANGAAVADYRAEFSATSQHITANLATLPALDTGTYYIAVASCSLAPVSFTVRATVVNSNGTGGTDEVRLFSGVPVSDVVAASAEASLGTGLLGSRQYVIDVPINATLLSVNLVGTTPGADVDLLIRGGVRVDIGQDGLPIADKLSATFTNVESLELDSSTQPRLVPGGRYFIAVSNFSQTPASFQLTATAFTSPTTPSELPLRSGIVQTGAVAGIPGSSTISHTNYVLLVPPGASQLRVDLLNNNGTDVDLFIRQGSRVFVSGNSVVRDFAASLGGPAQTLIINRNSFPSLDYDVYYIAVGNRAPTPISFSLVATVTQGGGTQFDTQAFHGNVVGSVVPPSQAGDIVVDGDQFFVDVPSAVTDLKARLDGDAGNELALLVRFGQRVSPTVVGGYDFFIVINGTGTITLDRPAATPFPALQAGRYYFAVANLSGNFVNYRLTFTMSPAPAPASLQFSALAYSATESAGSARITVTRTGNTATPVAVSYTTNNGTASSRSDYTTARGNLFFAPGETAKTFNVLIADDALAEGSETVGLSLSSPTGGAVLGAPAAATLTIADNDLVTGATNPLDGAQFFARQHYSDFLSRDPDAPGLQFWTNEIASCGTNTQCVEVKRVNVSAAFFLSIEYQQTGYLVYRLYKASFNRMPRLEEFQPDTQSIGSGVVVGAPNWEQQLESNKQAFLNAWVTRASFRNVYDGLDDVGYVDTLIANTGVPFSLAQRNALVLGLGAGTETRATVLRKVAEDQNFFQKELNPAFVLTQYFGYLRRNPNDAPDADFSGFNFWLGKLNQFNGDFVQAEMVRAFITSTEYRQRFGLH